MKVFKNIFVTVGTTEFDTLIEKLREPQVCEIIKNHLGCEKIKIQSGCGKKIDRDSFENIRIEVFDMKKSIENDIESADLIISHAGAGTCIDVLSKNKPLIVVINDNLMNNHQTELAEQLHNEKYLFCSTISELSQTLKNFDVTQLKEYKKGNVKEFVKYLDDFMGFV